MLKCSLLATEQAILSSEASVDEDQLKMEGQHPAETVTLIPWLFLTPAVTHI